MAARDGNIRSGTGVEPVGRPARAAAALDSDPQSAAASTPATGPPVVDMGDLSRYSSDQRMLRVEPRERGVHVLWDDDRVSEFHYMWLRDNCGCPECKHPQTLERTFDLLTVPEDIAAEAAAVTDAGALSILWGHDGHVSLYDAGWLRAHCPATDARPEAASPPLWGAELENDLPTVAYREVMGSDAALLDWLYKLRSTGFTVMRGVPCEELEVVRVARRISYPRETNFGTCFDVVSKPNPNNNSFTALAVPCHSDLPNHEMPPGFQFLHCLANDALGGGTVLVDGFHLAETLRREDAAAFEVLARTPLDFRFQDEAWDIRCRAPAIALSREGEIEQVRFSMHVMGALRAPPAEMEALYRAYRRLAALVRDARFEIRFKLQAGDMMSIDNRRIFHGRDGFEATSGRRHLQGCYVDRDEFLSRIRVLKREPDPG